MDEKTSTRVMTSIRLDTMRSIVATCDRYEAAWRNGQSPRLEDYLARAKGSSQTASSDRSGFVAARPEPGAASLALVQK
jgi:hypothetical protein